MNGTMTREAFERLADEYFDDIVRTASEMIRIRSVSGDEKAMADYTAGRMRELGYDEVRVDRAGSVVGLMNGTGGGKSLMLDCHLDVVDEGPHDKWKYPPFGGEVAEGAIWGRGASDTKGTFAIQLYTPYILKRAGLRPRGDVYVVGVVHEESSGFGAMTMAADGFVTDYAIMGEATENDVAVACRGCICIEVLVTGRSCHASIPEEGRNPFDFLGPFLVALKGYEGSSNPRYGRSLLSPTRVLSSEAGTNVIPNWVRLSLDYRSLPGETSDAVVGQLRRIAESCAVPGIEADISAATVPIRCYTGMVGEGLRGEPAFGIDEDDEAVVKAKAALENAFGRAVRVKPWAFATDSGHFAQKGAKVIGFSPAEIRKCHTVEDNIRLDMLREGIVGTLALTAEFCG